MSRERRKARENESFRGPFRLGTVFAKCLVSPKRGRKANTMKAKKVEKAKRPTKKVGAEKKSAKKIKEIIEPIVEELDEETDDEKSGGLVGGLAGALVGGLAGAVIGGLLGALVES